jgi:hypothetical protein
MHFNTLEVYFEGENTPYEANPYFVPANPMRLACYFTKVPPRDRPALYMNWPEKFDRRTCVFRVQPRGRKMNFMELLSRWPW